MNRIVILGCAGSGKSTLARRLGAMLNLPVIHLDRLFWNPGWIASLEERFVPMVAQAAAGERWVIDGNYTRTLEPRLAVADTVIYLDFPRWLCMTRVLKRTFLGMVAPRPDHRPDLPPNCPEQLDVEFIEWIWNYHARSRPKTLAILQALRDGKIGCGPRVIILRAPREVDDFLQTIASED